MGYHSTASKQLFHPITICLDSTNVPKLVRILLNHFNCCKHSNRLTYTYRLFMIHCKRRNLNFPQRTYFNRNRSATNFIGECDQHWVEVYTLEWHYFYCSSHMHYTESICQTMTTFLSIVFWVHTFLVEKSYGICLIFMYWQYLCYIQRNRQLWSHAILFWMTTVLNTYYLTADHKWFECQKYILVENHCWYVLQIEKNCIASGVIRSRNVWITVHIGILRMTFLRMTFQSGSLE